MSILSKLLGLGPLLTSVLILVVLALASFSPMLAPYMPFIAILLPSLVLGMIAWRRSYPLAVSYLRKSVSPEAFWNAISPDLRIIKIVTTNKTLSKHHPFAGKTVLFEDRSDKRGYAVKILKIADVQRCFETTTEHERSLLLDRMAKTIQGIGDVESKLIIDRSPKGEYAYIILYSEIEKGDEKSAVYSVENAAKTLSRSLEQLGLICLDDISYLEPIVSLTKTVKPSKIDALTLAFTSFATIATSTLCLDLGLLMQMILLSGLIGIIVSLKLLSSVKKAECVKCSRGELHPHFHIGGWDVEKIKVEKSGTIVLDKGSEKIYSRYLIFSGNSNRELSVQDIKERLNMYLRAFSTMLYSLEDFRIAIHVKPQNPGDVVRIALAKADWHGMDAQVGGAVSGYFKASRSMNLADRIMHGERPYLLSGVVEVRARAGGNVSENAVNNFISKQLQQAKSFLDSMNLSTREATDGWSAVSCKRFFYLPPPPTGFFESCPVNKLKALTRDFIFISPIAFKRRPAMPKEGLFLGEDIMGRSVFWNPETIPNPHILILGPPGSGKSTLVKTMLFRLEQLAKYSGTGRPPSVIIIDPAGEYADKADLLRELGLKVTVIDLMEKKYNPLLLAGLEPRQRASRFIDFILGNIMKLDRFQAGVLYEAIMLAYRKLGKIDEYDPETWVDKYVENVTIRKIYEYICWRAEETARIVSSRGGNPELDPATTLLRELARMLTPMAEGPFALDRTDITIESLLDIGGIVIVSFKTGGGKVFEGNNLKALAQNSTNGGVKQRVQVRMSDDLQKLIAWSILEHIKDYMTSLRAEEGLKLMVVIDEGHKFLKGIYEDVPLGQHLREGRKFGASYIIVTHLPEDIPPELPNLVGTTFIFGFGNPIEAERIAEMINLTKEELEQLMSMSTGEVYVKWINDPRPLYFTVKPDPRALVRERGDKKWLLYKMQ
ncbi:MAG: ATP-binding protein [Desulfurococcaceae archaeon]